MTREYKNYVELTRLDDKQERACARRKVRKGLLCEPMLGWFITAEAWTALPKDRQIVEKIRAAAVTHPNEILSGVSAAAILGAILWPRFHRHVHFATDEHTSTRNGKMNVYVRHYVKDCRKDLYKRATLNPVSAEKLLTYDSSYMYWLYKRISDVAGIVCGFLVTSPLQTMLDVVRQIEFEFALAVCDTLARLYHITREQIDEFLTKRARCRGIDYVRYVLGFIRTDSDNGGESFARARMIKAGFEIPELQVSVRNPFYSSQRDNNPTLQNTKTVRVDFMWKVPGSDGRTRCVAAEMDGRDKYTDARMLVDSGAQDGLDVLLRQHDREGALTLLGMTVLRFQFREAYEKNGESMILKLHRCGIPMVSSQEQDERRKWLIEYPQKHRLKFE
ncbi:hypothetical protein [Alloscardovia macacae]|nr:hypothetical protein [Alloscardovia macacae]